MVCEWYWRVISFSHCTALDFLRDKEENDSDLVGKSIVKERASEREFIYFFFFFFILQIDISEVRIFNNTKRVGVIVSKFY
jgi:hypothetical protein